MALAAATQQGTRARYSDAAKILSDGEIADVDCEFECSAVFAIAATQGVSGIWRECKALQRLSLVNSRPPCSRREELPFPHTFLHHRTRPCAYLIVYVFPRVIIYKMCDTLI